MFQIGLPVYRFVLIPNFKENKSCIIILSSHSLGDGMSFSSLLMALGDNYDPSALPCLKPLSWGPWLVLYLLCPLLALYSSYNLVFGYSQDQNSISRGRLSTHKHAHTTELPLSKVKALAKSQNCTVNSVIMALTSMSLYNYFKTIDN